MPRRMMSALRGRDERRVDVEARAFDAGARGQGRERFERADELGTAIGISGIVEGVDADENVARVEHLGPAERESEKDRIARGHVGLWNLGRRQIAIARNGDIRGQRRAADGSQIDGLLEMPFDAERPGDGPRRLDFADVPLAVLHGQRAQREPLRFRDGRGRVGIEAAT